MRAKIGPDGTLQDAVDSAWKEYRGTGLSSRGYRNGVLMAWGSVAGRERALLEFDAFLLASGTYDRATSAIGFSEGSLRKIRRHFVQLPSSLPAAPAGTRSPFTLGQALAADEGRLVQYKEIRGGGAVDSIKNTADEYAVAFLNSSGGRILWGVRDRDRVVVGVRLAYADRDRLRQVVGNKLSGIKPPLDPTTFRLEFHEVLEGRSEVPELFIVELVVPPSGGSVLFWTEGDEAFVMLDGIKMRLNGPQIEAFITRRQRLASGGSAARGQMSLGFEPRPSRPTRRSS
jgi:hypothetical protein